MSRLYQPASGLMNLDVQKRLFALALEWLRGCEPTNC